MIQMRPVKLWGKGRTRVLLLVLSNYVEFVAMKSGVQLKRCQVKL